ncbi:alpha/beta fold hydrolase, partial [Rhodoplanes sp. SY1]|uniref:alpha/beta fold hydrolase n=1 Tax=Rhodoplanes sp. SY1 TaxID=3166646 RepID=UPI0038B6A566
MLGRIAYGPPAGRASDFLCHWLHEEGFATLALSYPIATRGVFDVAFPRFSITDWAEQSAEIIARHVDGNGLAGNVIVLGWSMGGRIAEPLQAALRRRDKSIELFVAMAAATALPDILPGLNGLQPAASGLASIRGAYLDWLLLCLADQNRMAGRVVLDAETFTTEMTGDFPIGLAASAMRFRDGTFVHDAADDAREVGASRYGSFPPLALMTHASPLDARHALTDRATWGVFITQQLCETHVFPQASHLSALAPERWAAL